MADSESIRPQDPRCALPYLDKDGNWALCPRYCEARPDSEKWEAHRRTDEILGRKEPTVTKTDAEKKEIRGRCLRATGYRADPWKPRSS